MDITDIVSDEFVEFDPDSRVSKLTSAFEDQHRKGVIVSGDEFEGVVTRRQLATSHHQPNEKLESLVSVDHIESRQTLSVEPNSMSTMCVQFSK